MESQEAFMAVKTLLPPAASSRAQGQARISTVILADSQRGTLPSRTRNTHLQFPIHKY